MDETCFYIDFFYVLLLPSLVLNNVNVCWISFNTILYIYSWGYFWHNKDSLFLFYPSFRSHLLWTFSRDRLKLLYSQAYNQVILQWNNKFQWNSNTHDRPIPIR